MRSRNLTDTDHPAKIDGIGCPTGLQKVDREETDATAAEQQSDRHDAAAAALETTTKHRAKKVKYATDKTQYYVQKLQDKQKRDATDT